jgi:hypothetical protein
MMSFFEATMSRPAAGDAAARPARPRFVAAWAALALLAMPAAVAAQMTPEHVVQLEQAGSVALSPDGRFVAYTVTTPRAEEEQVGRAFSELWVVPAASSSSARGACRYLPNQSSILRMKSSWCARSSRPCGSRG